MELLKVEGKKTVWASYYLMTSFLLLRKRWGHLLHGGGQVKAFGDPGKSSHHPGGTGNDLTWVHLSSTGKVPSHTPHFCWKLLSTRCVLEIIYIMDSFSLLIVKGILHFPLLKRAELLENVYIWWFSHTSQARLHFHLSQAFGSV